MKIVDEEKVGFINGLVVYGFNSGVFLEIEVKVIFVKEKGNIIIIGIVEEESIGI